MIHRNVNRLILAASMLGFAGLASAGTPATSAASCFETTRMVTIWNPGPRPSPQARVEKRIVTVCDGKVVKQSKE
jgi:hypothetical protein